jgi:hypothetical protein
VSLNRILAKQKKLPAAIAGSFFDDIKQVILFFARE